MGFKMYNFFYPQNVAVVGVSDSPSNWGKLIIKNLMEFGFNGSYYAVGLQGASVYDKPIYRSVSDIPGELDLAMVLVKAQNVPQIAEECGERGIKRLIISTAGFSEFRVDKKEIEDRLLDICQRYEIRFIGPNCMAVVNMDNGLFLPFGLHNRRNWQKGPVAVVSQSGTISMHAGLDLSYEKIGVSKVASAGNKLNVDEVDLIEYLLNDSETEIVFLHLEGLSRAGELCELAASSDKPIIILKSNISPQSHGIAKSHTSSLASDEKVVDAAFRQAGIIRVNNLEEMVNCAKVLLLPRLKGKRIACLSNGGGTAVTVADDAHRNGFELPSLPQGLYQWLEGKGRAKIITLTNPIDLGDIYDMDALIQAIAKLLELHDIDGVFYDLIYSVEWVREFPYFKTFFEWYQQSVLQFEKPFFLNISLDTKYGWPELNAQFSHPFFRSVSAAFRGMGLVMDARQSKAPKKAIASENIDPSGRIASIIKTAIDQNRSFLDYDGYSILEKLGIPLVRQHYLSREEFDKKVSTDLKFPLAVKAVGIDLAHKTDVGGVRLNIKDAKELWEALSVMDGMPGLFPAHGFLLQEMIDHGIEMIVGAKRDPQFGPVVMVGMGGVLVDLFSDVNPALAPVDKRYAKRMIESLKGYKLLKGYRGATPADVDSLCEIIQAVSDLIVHFPEISAIDLNPVKVLDQGNGSIALDYKIFLDSRRIKG